MKTQIHVIFVKKFFICILKNTINIGFKKGPLLQLLEVTGCEAIS